MTPYSQMSPYQKRLLFLVSASSVSWHIHSALAGLCPDMISKILCGRRSNSTYRTLMLLASYFNVSVDWLLGFDMRE